MVHFFGILSPDFIKPRSAPDAPRKVAFFGGLPHFAFASVPMSRVEQDAAFLAGKGPEPVEDDHGLVTHFARMPRPF